MARELKGTRYLANPEFGELIQRELPFLDFDETVEFYEWAETIMTDKDRALLNCNDRYYLLIGSCHRQDALHPWIFERCREVERDPDNHLDLWARYHYKSTICTFAGIIQEVMIDPEITCAIISGYNKVAQPFLKQIMEEFESNDDLKRIHDDVLWAEPRKEAPQWALDKGIIVKRKGNPKEATIEAFGLIDGSGRTGKHYGLLDFDDLIDETMVDNPDVVKKVTMKWELADNLGTTFGKTRKWHQGTRYSYADSYGIMIDRAILKTRIHPATDNGQLNGTPVLVDSEKWASIKKTQRSTVAAQMLLNPQAGNENMFSMQELRHYDVFPSVLNVYILVDPSKGNTARSDRTAIAVIGIDVAGNKYLLDGYCHRMKLSRRYELMCQLREKWSNHPGVQMVRVGYEQYGMQVDLEVIEEKQLRDGEIFQIEELNTPKQGKHSKKDRMSRLEPDFNGNSFYLPAVVFHPEFSGDYHTQALWEVWTEEDWRLGSEAGMKSNPSVGTVVYRPMRGPTRQQKYCEATFQGFRNVRALRRLNEDGEVYDLTRIFIEEYRLAPFAPHDDLTDCASRIYDMEPTKPVPFETVGVEPRTHVDS
jgi:hypothetical protein